MGIKNIISESYKTRLKELAGILLKEGVNQELAMSILKKSGHENYFDKIKSIDLSKNNKLLPFIALFYVNGINDLNVLKKDFEDYNKFLELKKVAPLQLKKGKIFLGDKEINYLKFSEKVHALSNLYHNKPKLSDTNDAQPIDAKPVFSKSGIVDVYEGHSRQSCIKYGAGYPFCISQPYGTMYQSYRDTQGSTFYFVFDRTRDKSDPLHIVVVDITENEGILLTDHNNDTGNIDQFGDDSEGYIDYLSSLGVPVEIFKNNPYTEQEKEELKLLGTRNVDLKWFVGLNKDYKSKYIGRGHILSDEQFMFLWNNKAYDLLSQYVNIGLALNNFQLNKISENNNLLKSYLRQRLIASKQTHDFNYTELSLCSFENKTQIIQQLTDDNIMYLLFYDKELGVGLSIINLLIKYKKEKLSDNNIKYILKKANILDLQIEGTLSDTINDILSVKGDILNGNNASQLIGIYIRKSKQDIEGLCEKIGVDKINLISDFEFDELFHWLADDESVDDMYKLALILIKYKTNLNERNILRIFKLSRNKSYTADRLGTNNILKLSSKSIGDLLNDNQSKDSEEYLKILVKFKNNYLSHKEIVSLLLHTKNRAEMVKNILMYKSNLTNDDINTLIRMGITDEVKNIVFNSIGKERAEQIMNNNKIKK